MNVSFSTKFDQRVERYLKRLQMSRRMSPAQASAELMKVGYYELVRRLHQQYLNGEITLRQMARELGLEYRETYALLEELHLPIA
jgi:hypothetical protein